MEPERKIEKLLRAYAKRRRDQAGAPLDLHPATRRLLQGEVARRAPRALDGGFFARLVAVLRPRWAFALGGAAVVVLAVALLWPSLHEPKPESSLASVRSEDLRKVDELKKQPATPPPATVPAPRTASAPSQPRELPAGATAVDKTGESGDRVRTAGTDVKLDLAAAERTQFDEMKTAAPPAARRPDAISGSTGAMTIARADGSAKPEAALADRTKAAATGDNLTVAAAEAGQKNFQFAGGAATSPASAPTPALAGRGGFGGASPARAAGVRYWTVVRDEASTNALLSRGQRFVQEIAKSAATPSNVTPVLTTFSVEQNGRALRVVDSDGSTYDGFVQLGGVPMQPAAMPQRGLSQAAIAVTKDSSDQAAGVGAARNYFFRVTGTNRSLKQNVVFSGNLLAVTNALPFSSTSNVVVDLGAAQLPGAAPGLEPLPLQNSRINGTILIDNTRQIQIEAAPAAPATPR